MVEGQLRDSTRSIPIFFLHNENQSTIKIQTYISGSPLRSDGVDETGDANKILVRATHRTTGHSGHIMIGSIRTEQPAGHKRRAAGRPAGDRIPEETAIHRDSRCTIPRKRALFTSDGSDSMTSGSDTPESHADGPPAVEYSERLMTEKRQDEGGTERLCSPHMELEMAVIQLQKDFDDCRTEFEITRRHTPAVDRRPPRQARFTSTPVPRYSGKSNWEQYHEIFEAIVCSNGWDDVTAALQLLSHLDGDALNIALLIPESRRVVPGFLIKSLSDQCTSPGGPWVVRRPERWSVDFCYWTRNAGSKGLYWYWHFHSATDGTIPIQWWTGGVCTPQTFGQFGTWYSYGRHSRLLSCVGKSPGCRNRAKDERGQTPCERGLPSDGWRTDT